MVLGKSKHTNTLITTAITTVSNTVETVEKASDVLE